MITSSGNTQIKNIIQLQKKHKLRQEQKVFICEGKKMFEEAKEFVPELLVKAYVAENFYHEICKKQQEYFRAIEFEIVADSLFHDMSETVTPQGILAVIRQPEYSLEEMMAGENTNLMLLENLQDPGNLGTIVRTAEGAGIHGIILSQGSCDLFNPKVIRATMGSIYRMPIIYVDDFYAVMHKLRQNSFYIYAAHLEGSVSYDKPDYHGKTAIAIGNEANGLSIEAAAIADLCIRIPMAGRVESLNAGIAAAILMYEVSRKNKII